LTAVYARSGIMNDDPMAPRAVASDSSPAADIELLDRERAVQRATVYDLPIDTAALTAPLPLAAIGAAAAQEATVVDKGQPAPRRHVLKVKLLAALLTLLVATVIAAIVIVLVLGTELSSPTKGRASSSVTVYSGRCNRHTVSRQSSPSIV